MLVALILSKIAVLLAVLIKVCKVDRRAVLVIGGALALGLTGYIAQGQPGLPQSLIKTPPSASEENTQIESAFQAAKAKIATDPANAEHWTTLANALMARNRVLVPAADFSYRKALQIKPGAMDAAYFYGLALAESGRAEEARDQWIKLASKIPANEPRRKELLAAMFATGIISEKDVSKAELQQSPP
jgi:cytochrome c-type biogenesis protein CcmH